MGFMNKELSKMKIHVIIHVITEGIMTSVLITKVFLHPHLNVLLTPINQNFSKF